MIKNLKNMTLYSASTSRKRPEFMPGEWERNMGSGREVFHIAAIFQLQKPMADAMASWRMPWVLNGEHWMVGGHDERHAPMENAISFKAYFSCIFFRVGGATWLPHHGERHGGRHQYIFFISSLFFIHFCPVFSRTDFYLL